jgi:hypothetical protein
VLRGLLKSDQLCKGLFWHIFKQAIEPIDRKYPFYQLTSTRKFKHVDDRRYP